MFVRSFFFLLGASGIYAASCPDVSVVTVLSSTTVYVPATTFLTVSSTVSTSTDITTITSEITSFATETSYTGTTPTSYIFLPGSPPAKREVEARSAPICNADNCLRALRATSVLASVQAFCSSYTATPSNPIPLPSYVPLPCNPARVSSACPCLQTMTVPSTTSSTAISSTTSSTSTSSSSGSSSTTSSCPTPTTTTVIVTISMESLATNTQVAPITDSTSSIVTVLETTVGTTTVFIPPPATTKTGYPCATIMQYAGPTFGDAHPSIDLQQQNFLYGLRTPEGANTQSCCNLCFFGLTNCVNAYWYDYQGCIVSQAFNLGAGTGEGTSATCPVGVFNGLTYWDDIAPAFRSTGNIAGPCGQTYLNF